jgi:hypothetical protein
MTDSAWKLIRKHATLVIVGAAALVAGWEYAASLLFAPERAIMHDGRLVFADCELAGAEPGRGCVAEYEFMLANTGRREERVVATWPAAIGRWSLQERVQNIAADEPRSHDPVVACSAAAGQSECIVDRFAPGTLLILRFRCLPCGGGEIAGLGEARPGIQTEARVYRGDPRVSALVRRLQVLFY